MTQKERERFYSVSMVHLKATCLSGIGEMRDLNVRLTLSRDGLIFTQPKFKLKSTLDIYRIYNIELISQSTIEQQMTLKIPYILTDPVTSYLRGYKRVPVKVTRYYILVTYDETREIIFEIEKKHRFQASYFVNFWNSFLVGEPQVQEDDAVYDSYGFRIVDLGEQRRTTTRRRLERPLLDLQFPESYLKKIEKNRKSGVFFLCFLGFMIFAMIAFTAYAVWYVKTHPDYLQDTKYMDSHVLASSYTGEPDEIDLLLSDFDDIRAETVQEG